MAPKVVIQRQAPQFEVNRALAPSPVNVGGGAPVVLSAVIKTPPGGGQVQVFDAQTLQPGFRTPYWIDEIRMAMTTFGGADAFGSNIDFRFQAGNLALSKDYVPMLLHAPRFGGDGINDSPTNRALTESRWPLPKPLYMGAGDVLLASMRNRLSVAQNASTPIEAVYLTYVGRLASPGTPPPASRQVPWLAYTSQLATANNVYAQVGDTFRNPFNKTLWVQRFTARCLNTMNAAFDDQSEQIDGPSAAGGSIWPEVKIYDSMGYAIVPDWTPTNDVFDFDRRAWTFGRTLGPREQFDVQLRSSATGVVTGTGMRTYIGMVGFREEAV